MDVATLAKELTAFLLPFLPYAQKLSGKAAEEVGKKLGQEGWEKAKILWGKLGPKIEGKPSMRDAIKDAVASPEDEDAQGALRLQMKKLLTDDAALARELESLWSTMEPEAESINASGDRSVAIGGGVSSSTIVTGDRNRLQR